MKEGDDGSEDNGSESCRRFSARLLRFLDFRGPGDVMGRSSCSGVCLGVLSAIFKPWNESRPNVVPEKEDKGTTVVVMGDEGEELGEGSVIEDESTVEMVVVGEESVESEFWVDVLSRC